MTIRVCITGQPVSYSRSPLLHGFWLKEHGIDGFYGREEVPPETAADFYRSLAARGYAGCNVTAPNKEIAFSVLDEADPSAVALGAANTLWLEGGRLCGANTDGYGFLANLDATVPGWEGARRLVLVLGAGGASRAVVRGLVERGFDRVLLVNRTLARAEEVAKPFPGKVHPRGWEAVPAADYYQFELRSLGERGAEVSRYSASTESTQVELPLGGFERGAYSVRLQAFGLDKEKSTRLIGYLGRTEFSFKNVSRLVPVSPEEGASVAGLDARRAGVDFSWKQEDAIESAELLVARDPDFRAIAARRGAVSGGARVERLESGDYYWTVKAAA